MKGEQKAHLTLSSSGSEKWRGNSSSIITLVFDGIRKHGCAHLRKREKVNFTKKGPDAVLIRVGNYCFAG
jgi:hypothetical protein